MSVLWIILSLPVTVADSVVHLKVSFCWILLLSVVRVCEYINVYNIFIRLVSRSQTIFVLGVFTLSIPTKKVRWGLCFWASTHRNQTTSLLCPVWPCSLCTGMRVCRHIRKFWNVHLLILRNDIYVATYKAVAQTIKFRAPYRPCAT